MKNKSFSLPFIFLVFCMCANQGMPPGGPVDKTPPDVLLTIPSMAATNVPLDTHVEFHLSEPIKPQKALDAVFITPFPGDDVQIRLRGKRLRIVYENGLKPDKTYVITLGTDIRDYRNNGLEESYTLAFTTGDSLDTGSISGQVYGLTDAKGVDVWAYPVIDSAGPNPEFTEPEYVVQCSKSGHFQFGYLSPGTYRVFAIRDRIADRLYQKVEDEIGVPPRDVYLTSSNGFTEDSLYFRLFREDTLSPTLLQAKSLHRNLYMLRFDEPVTLNSIDQINMVSSEDSLERLKCTELYTDPQNMSNYFVKTEDQRDQIQYRFKLDTLYDDSGNLLDSSWQSIVLNSSTQLDTMAPKIIQLSPSPADMNVPLDQNIEIVFSELIDTTHVNQAIKMQDSTGTKISYSYIRKHPFVLNIKQKQSFESKMIYTITIQDSMISDLSQNFMQDTSYTFTTIDKDTLSEVMGKLIDKYVAEEGQYIVTLQKTGQEEILYTKKKVKSGQFHFDVVLPGQYILNVLHDADNNDKYTHGEPFPYIPSERYLQYADTIKVRSRWTNDGNIIQLP